MVSISMCMIVKNEEALLSRCLESYKGLFDEIIIVDTGSSDNTKKIAAQYTDKIYDYEWCSDFAAARNFAFDKASCDYIFTADADEVLDNKNKSEFLKLKQVLDYDVDIVQMKYVTPPEYNTVYNCIKEYRPKLFKRLRTFKWVSPIHETVRLEPIVFDSDIEILHMPAGRHEKRDFAIFINAVKSGVRLEKYVLKMFCKELLISGNDNDFIAVSDIFTDKLSKDFTDTECVKAINCILARIYRITGNEHEFFKICLKDIAVDPCSEICTELGEYYYNKNDYAEAVLWFINAADETSSILNIRSAGDIPLFRLADCYDRLFQLADKSGDIRLKEIYLHNRDEYKKRAESWSLPAEL